MLSEEQVEIISDAIRPLFQYLEHEIIKDIAKRIEKAEKYTRTVELKVEAMQRLGYSPAKIRTQVMKLLRADEGFQQLIYENTIAYKKECKKLMKEAQKTTDALVREITQYAANMSFWDDTMIWEEHGKTLKDMSYLNGLVEAIAEQTRGAMKNLTNTTAVGFHTQSGLKKLPDVYRNELDKALIKISTGTYSSSEVINDTIHNLSESGLRSIDYKSGRSMQIDTAAKVAIRTAVNQIAAKVEDENIIRSGENLIYVSTHWGARDKGEGIENHAAWQGKVYFIRSEKDYAREAARIGQKSIEDIWECTGYSPDGSRTNDPLGLHGYNCKHKHYVWFEGASAKPVEPQKPGPYTINGKIYTYYDMTQKMRSMERKIRALRREREAMKALGQPVDVLEASIKEKTRNYTDFCEEYNLKPQTENLRIEPNSSDVKKTKAWKDFEGLAKQEATTGVSKAPSNRRTEIELRKAAEEYKKKIDDILCLDSKWSGKILVDNKLCDELKCLGAKQWDCTILLKDDATDHTIVHELTHSYSVSYYTPEDYLECEHIEEGSVEYFAREYLKKENLMICDPAYEKEVKILDTLNNGLHLYDSNFAFARELIKQPMTERYDWLQQKVNDAMMHIDNITVQDIDEIMEFMENLRIRYE